MDGYKVMTHAQEAIQKERQEVRNVMNAGKNNEDSNFRFIPPKVTYR